MTTQSKHVANIAIYNGYKHNRYDGYQCSWGILMALGASSTADCFADEDDYPDEDFDTAYESGPDDQESFDLEMLQNLDLESLEKLRDELLEEGIYEHTEYWGQGSISVTFTKHGNTVYVECDGRKYLTDIKC